MNSPWVDLYPRNVKCSVECDDGENAYCVCAAAMDGMVSPSVVKHVQELRRRQRQGGQVLPPLSELTRDMPTREPDDKLRSKWVNGTERIIRLTLRIVIAFLLSLVIAGTHNGATFIVLCWLLIAVWLEIVSFRFAVTRK